MKQITVNKVKEYEIIVTESMLASKVGSGIVDVYATPMMVALMEQTAVMCLAEFMEGDETSVGIRMDTTHEAATPVGMRVIAKATITAVEGKKVTFAIIASDESSIIGRATHERFIVNKHRFEEKAKNKAK